MNLERWRITFVESTLYSEVKKRETAKVSKVVVYVSSLRAINITTKILLSLDLLLPRIT